MPFATTPVFALLSTGRIVAAVPNEGETGDLVGRISFLTLSVSFVFILALLSWRHWSFTIKPSKYPDEPLELPYWVPYLGHGIAYFRDSQGLINQARAYLSNNGYPPSQPFALTVFGQKIYIVTTGQDAAATFRNTKTLAWEPFLRDLVQKLGVRPGDLSKMWDDPGPEDIRYTNSENPKHKSLVHYSEELYRKSLLPGSLFEDFSAKLLGRIGHSLSRENAVLRCIAGVRPISLMDFCAQILIEAMTRTLFGDSIYVADPRMTQHLYNFNEEAWKLLIFPYPKFLTQRLHAAKEGISAALQKYMRAPEDAREDSSWLMNKIFQEQKAAGCDDEARASITFLLLWASIINVYRLSFWMILHILHSPALYKTIRTEITPAFSRNIESGDIETDHAYLYTHCPRLSAVYNELLRLAFGSVSVRTVTTPIIMSSKTLQPGNTVMIPIRSLHYNEDVFGSDVASFDATRFLNNDREKSQNFRPFAGGATYCPGRFIAKRQTLVFVGLLLGKFDVTVQDSNQSPEGEKSTVFEMPKIDHACPTIGMLGPVKGSTMRVLLSERKDL